MHQLFWHVCISLCSNARKFLLAFWNEAFITFRNEKMFLAKGCWKDDKILNRSVTPQASFNQLSCCISIYSVNMLFLRHLCKCTPCKDYKSRRCVQLDWWDQYLKSNVHKVQQRDHQFWYEDDEPGVGLPAEMMLHICAVQYGLFHCKEMPKDQIWAMSHLSFFTCP